MLNLTDVNLYPYTFEITANESLRRSTTKFGDGYAETRVKGINSLISVWDVSFFFTTLEKAKTFVALLRENRGTVTWISPLDTTAKNYLINQWSITPESPINYTVRCSLSLWYGN